MVDALNSIANQTRRPDELIVICRDDDMDSIMALAEWKAPSGLNLIHPTVNIPGFIEPVRQGIKVATGDIIAFMDDDAKAHPNWLERLTSWYEDDLIGGVGGRCVDFKNGVEMIYPSAKHIAKITWYGRCIGNMYRDASDSCVRKADFLMGSNMSFRSRLLDRVKWDKRLENNVAFYWEIDVALQISAMNSRLLYDPDAKVDHFNGPREIIGMRWVNYDGVYAAAHNATLIVRKHLSTFRFFSYLSYTIFIGNSASPGLAYLVYALFVGKKISWRDQVVASIKGRLKALA